MPTITPVSDLRNYGNVLEKVEVGSPVYLTWNGHGVYSIRDIEDEENFQKAEAMIHLMCELNAGIRSSEEDGWISEEDFRNHIHDMEHISREAIYKRGNRCRNQQRNQVDRRRQGLFGGYC